MTYRVSLMTPSMPHTMRGLRREMDRAVESLLAAPHTTSDAAWAPAADVVEDDAGWTIALDVPGVSPDALDVLAEDRTLTIRGERPATTVPDGARAATRERRAGSFTRQFRLPTSADAEQLSAALAHGVLTLRIGKVAPAQPRRVPVHTDASVSESSAHR
jgi:HSP20 family protein